jgi:hypothetical protein
LDAELQTSQYTNIEKVDTFLGLIPDEEAIKPVKITGVHWPHNIKVAGPDPSANESWSNQYTQNGKQKDSETKWFKSIFGEPIPALPHSAEQFWNKELKAEQQSATRPFHLIPISNLTSNSQITVEQIEILKKEIETLYEKIEKFQQTIETLKLEKKKN